MRKLPYPVVIEPSFEYNTYDDEYIKLPVNQSVEIENES